MIRGSETASAKIGNKALRPVLSALLMAIVITLLSLLLSRIPLGRALELASFDWRLRVGGRALDATNVMVVHLDPSTLERYPETGFPIPRSEYAAFIDGVMRCGARAILLDLLFIFPDRNGPEHDENLAAALRNYGDRIVLPGYFPLSAEDNPNPPWWRDRNNPVLYKTEERLLPLEPLSAVTHLGHAEVVPDVDGVTRRTPLLIESGGRLTPAASLATAMVYLGIPDAEIVVVGSEVRAGSGGSCLRIPVDARGCLLPRSLYRGHTRGPRHSFEDVMAVIRGEKPTVHGKTLESLVKDRIILLGMGGIMPDTAPTPWGANTEGVDIHAGFIESILNGRTARPISAYKEILGVFLLSLGVRLFAPLVPISRALLVVGAVIVGYLASTVLALTIPGIILPVVSPTLAMVLSSTLTVYRRVRTGERWRAVRETELEKARRMQQMLLPKGLLELPGVDLFGSLEPCFEVAGDSYDYFVLEDRYLALSVSDVSGKGEPAAVLMSNIQGCLRTEARYLKTPAKVVSAVNGALSAVLEPTSYATMVYAVLDLKERRMACCLAGHPSPLILRSDGSIARFRAGGPPIGILADAAYQEEEMLLEPGTVVVFYTDGITEASAPSGEFFEEKRLAALLRKCADLDAERIATRAMAEVETYTARAPASDDRTILAVKML